MITVLHQPPLFSTTGNPIAYHLRTDQTGPMILGLRLFIRREVGTGHEMIYQAELPADQNGEAVFYLEEIIASYLRPYVPFAQPFTVFHQPKTVVKDYFVFVSERRPGLPETSEQLLTRWAALGRIDPTTYPQTPGAVPGTAQVLSARPLRRRTSYLLPEWLCAISSADRTLLYTYLVRYADGGTTSFSVMAGFVPAWQPVFHDISFATRNYAALNPGRQIADVVVQSSDGTGQVILQLTEFRSPHVRAYLYVSPSTGGIETLVCTGERTSERKYAREQFRTYRTYNYRPHTHELGTYTHEYVEEYEQATGFLTRDEYQAGLEIFESPAVWLWQNGQAVAIQLSSAETPVRGDADTLNTFVFSYRIAHTYRT